MGFSLKPSDRKYKDTNPEDLDFSLPKQEKVIQETKEKDFDPWDYVRVVNVKGEPEYQAKDDEKVVIGHRVNLILGNKHIMLEKTMKERDRVIAEYKKDLEADLAIQGPIWQTLQNIAKEIVENKQKFAISCHCSPIRCHNDLVIPVVVSMVESILEKKTRKQKSY